MPVRLPWPALGWNTCQLLGPSGTIWASDKTIQQTVYKSPHSTYRGYFLPWTVSCVGQEQILGFMGALMSKGSWMQMPGQCLGMAI